MKNVEDIMFSNILAANAKATYVRYISVGKIMIKHHGMLTPLEELAKDE